MTSAAWHSRTRVIERRLHREPTEMPYNNKGFRTRGSVGRRCVCGRSEVQLSPRLQRTSIGTVASRSPMSASCDPVCRTSPPTNRSPSLSRNVISHRASLVHTAAPALTSMTTTRPSGVSRRSRTLRVGTATRPRARSEPVLADFQRSSRRFSRAVSPIRPRAGLDLRGSFRHGRLSTLHPFSELYAARTVVRWVELDIETAHRVAAEVPTTGDPGARPIVAPVVRVAITLRIPVLTRQPRRYAGYDVQIEQMP